MSQVEEPLPQHQAAPWRPSRKPGRLGFAALALAAMPMASLADGITYGHAEVTLGFPNGHVTVGKTWETGPRVVTVTHELPADDDCDREDEDDREVIIEKRVEKPKKVVIIEREEPEVVVIEKRPAPRQVVVVREEPRYCDRVIVRESCPRPSRIVVVRPERHRHVTVISGGYDRRESRYESRHESRPRDLFESRNSRPAQFGGERPMRERGVQHIRVDR